MVLSRETTEPLFSSRLSTPKRNHHITWQMTLATIAAVTTTLMLDHPTVVPRHHHHRVPSFYVLNERRDIVNDYNERSSTMSRIVAINSRMPLTVFASSSNNSNTTHFTGGVRRNHHRGLLRPRHHPWPDVAAEARPEAEER